MIKLCLFFILATLSLNSAFAVFADGTSIRVEGGTKKIEEIGMGDEVRVMANGSSLSKVSLSEDKIAYTAGTQHSSQNMINVRYGENQNLIVTRDHIFLLYTQKFKRAGHLVPGDQLLGEDGSPKQVLMVALTTFQGGVHHIASDSDDNLDNCYIANGVWVGSYKHEVFGDVLKIENRNIFEDFPLR